MKEGAYSDLPGSLPGTSSAVPSSWALQKTTVSHLRLFCRRSTKRGKKSRLASDGRTLRSPRRLTHDCGLADYARKDFFRALSGSSAKSVFYSGSGLFFWLRGCVRSFVCGVSSSFPNGNLKLCVRWASLMSSQNPFHIHATAHAASRSLLSRLALHRLLVCRIHARVMTSKYDPAQVTQPLEVARQAALVGGASGTYLVDSYLDVIVACCTLAILPLWLSCQTLRHELSLGIFALPFPLLYAYTLSTDRENDTNIMFCFSSLPFNLVLAQLYLGKCATANLVQQSPVR